MVPTPGGSQCPRHKQQRQLQHLLSFSRLRSRFPEDTVGTPPSTAVPARLLLRQVAFTAAAMMIALRLRPCTAFVVSTPTPTAMFQQNRIATAASRYSGGRAGGGHAAATAAAMLRRPSPPLVVAMRAAAVATGSGGGDRRRGAAADAATTQSAMEHARQGDGEAGLESLRQVLETTAVAHALCIFACVQMLESARGLPTKTSGSRGQPSMAQRGQTNKSFSFRLLRFSSRSVVSTLL